MKGRLDRTPYSICDASVGMMSSSKLRQAVSRLSYRRTTYSTTKLGTEYSVVIDQRTAMKCSTYLQLPLGALNLISHAFFVARKFPVVLVCASVCEAQQFDLTPAVLESVDSSVSVDSPLSSSSLESLVSQSLYQPCNPAAGNRVSQLPPCLSSEYW